MRVAGRCFFVDYYIRENDCFSVLDNESQSMMPALLCKCLRENSQQPSARQQTARTAAVLSATRLAGSLLNIVKCSALTGASCAIPLAGTVSLLRFVDTMAFPFLFA